MEGCWVLANDFDEGLNRSCPVDIHGDVDDCRDRRLDELLQVLDLADLDELLTEVVAELICHDLRKYVHHRKKKASDEVIRT